MVRAGVTGLSGPGPSPAKGDTMNKSFKRLAVTTAVLALVVIVLGAWVRLSDAGLGCPDWPGCYGQLTWPDAHHEVQRANEAFPERPVESHKAWKEMFHRYVAGTLVLLVLALNWLAWRTGQSTRMRGLCALLLALIFFQAALGMWTVTLKLLPVVVMAHLLGGMATLALLTWIARSARPSTGQPTMPIGRPLAFTALLVLVVQIALGGWVSSNYAALACPDFPACQGQAWPDMDFAEGFVLLREIGVDFEGGILDLPSRTAIHMAHRVGAMITLLVLLFTASRLITDTASRNTGLLLLALVSLQFLLGVLNVMLHLPLANAVAHNGVAALLLVVLTTTLHGSTARGRA